MDIRLSVLLYSEYSMYCNRFLKNIDEALVDIRSAVRLRILNIDNKKIRNQILGSSVISVKIVPCVLVVRINGVVEKYEGQDAFNWLEQLILALSPVPSSPVIEESSPPVAPSDDNPPNPLPEPSLSTPIADLKDEPSESPSIPRPKASVLTGSGAYEFQEFGTTEDVDRSTTKGINTSRGVKKDVVSVAQAMQKAREADFEKLKPPGMP